MNEIKKLHPEFEYILWSKVNITKTNFPFTYDIIQTILEFNKVSTFNKLAAVADFMRL